jgi:outer membrane protein OmpA-like peptidoglycan-associated protein
MKCHPWRWLWGLLPLAVWTWIAVLGEHERIEFDLRRRTQEALGAARLGWAGTAFSGRDGILTGRAADENEPVRALRAMREVWGVRLVDARTEAPGRPETAAWSASLRDSGLKIHGVVPDEETRMAVLGVAKANFPQIEVDDRMKLAAAPAARDRWLGTVGFAVKVLANLRRGTVEYNGADLSISGEAESFASYKAARSALRNLPQGVRLAGDRLVPPPASPFVWRVKQSGGELVLSGFVPSEPLRAEVVEGAKRLFPDRAVVDRMDTAAGAPPGWAKAAAAALEQLAHLTGAKAEIKDRSVSISGQASDAAAAEAVVAALRAGAPAGFEVTDAFTHAEAPAVPAGPYVTTIAASAAGVELAGLVPSEAAHAVLVEAARSRWRGLPLTDRLQIAAGAGDGWQACMLAGVAGLARLSSGRAHLSGARLELTGETEDQALVERLPAALREAADQSCETDVRLALAAPAAVAEPRPARTTGHDRDADAAAARTETAAIEPRQAIADRCQDELRKAVNSGVIHFSRASADLDGRSRPTLEELARIAKACPEVLIEIEGHTDAEGTPERNARLSKRRAEAVAQYLAEAGVDAERLSAIGYGETRPVAPNDTAGNRARNRRIEFAVRSQ